MKYDFWEPEGGRSPVLDDLERELEGPHAITYIEKAIGDLGLFSWEELLKQGVLVELDAENPQRLNSFSFSMGETRGHFIFIIDHDRVHVCLRLLHFYVADNDAVPESNRDIGVTRAKNYWSKYTTISYAVSRLKKRATKKS